MKKITWKNEKIRVGALFPAAYNPRKISEKGRADLTASVDRFGRVEPLVANTDGTLIGGHQRLAVYAEKGIEEVEVMVPSRRLTKAEEKELNLRLNKNVGEWDWAKLGALGEDLLVEVGFDEGELRVGIGLSAEGDVDVDETRMEVLEVVPPESLPIRERAQVHFRSKEDYDAVRKWIDENGSEDMAKILTEAAR